jgi:hypothetical protein
MKKLLALRFSDICNNEERKTPWKTHSFEAQVDSDRAMSTGDT